jgi:hypothetical protein
MTTRTINEGTFNIVLAGDYQLAPSMLIRLRRIVSLARQNMTRVLTLTGQSQHEAFRACMGAYFRVPSGSTLGAYNGWVLRLKNNLQELNTHLQSRDLTLHTAIGQHPGMEDAAAYVQREIGVGALFELVAMPNPNSRAAFYGDIYMKFGQLGADHVAAATVVHEASHRYLGTRDWAYLPNNDLIAYQLQWTQLNIPVPYARSRNALKAWDQMSVDEALNNADSYSGFVSRMRIPL